jgi:hypothetical protein
MDGRARAKQDARAESNAGAIAENAVSRFKALVGIKLTSRKLENQRTEALVKVRVLNRMSEGEGDEASCPEVEFRKNAATKPFSSAFVLTMCVLHGPLVRHRGTIVMSIPKRTDRIDLRVSPETKKALQAAAKLRRTSVSDFVLASALRAADEELADRLSALHLVRRAVGSLPSGPGCAAAADASAETPPSRARGGLIDKGDGRTLHREATPGAQG